MVVYRSSWLLETDFNENAIADVIFVSNLNNQTRTALEVPGDTDWFEKRLPKNFPNAQKFLYQYHGTHASLADTVSDAATQLLSEWDKLEKTESSRFMTDPLLTSSQLSRPVIFVCHGLGGLVVKKALICAEARSKIPLVLRRTFGVIFVGTPHTSETRDLVEFQRRTSLLSNACFSRMDENGEGVDYLLHISHSFPRIGGLYMSVNFCQSSCSGTRALHPDCLWSMISQSQISQHEAKHWVISEHCSEDIISSNIGICTGYMIEVAARVSQNCRSLLASAQAAKDKYSKERLGNTGEWLLALKPYRNWIRAEGSSLLWLHGLPGTGKSTLCSAVIDDLRSCREEKDLVIYCFLEDAPGRPDSAKYILRTIAYQLRANLYSLAPDHLLRSILKTVEVETETDKVTSEVFKQSLRDIFWAIDSQARISLVIDGTESADGTSGIVVDEIIRANSSRKSSKRLKCAISTRSPFQAACCKGSAFEINLSNQPGAQRDLKAFAFARLTSHSPALFAPGIYLQRV
ncbi:hypothetical protein N7G274_001300 [Stereocaulon virgatum]|uniref:Nephrocystin 3-like N-terminal domain-containing protein n=1 Tax=Stereocaulon virgatum TaxID=373712 RepID=A0ABR4AR62_9LECA